MTDTPTDYPLPLIHLNGTGRDTLLQEYRDALTAARAAHRAFAATTCHGRDFYPLHPGAFAEARDRRDLHMFQLNDLLLYLESHVAHLTTS
jgi:hypothetical protein